MAPSGVAQKAAIEPMQPYSSCWFITTTRSQREARFTPEEAHRPSTKATVTLPFLRLSSIIIS